MKTTGIIAEFNPFHNGHKYLLSQARELTGADRIIVIMSGNYIQRGGPAFLNKFARTKAALLNGADMVIELPFCYSMSKASVFATGAVSILNQLGCVDYLCFGCEINDLSLLDRLAEISINEPPIYQNILKKHLQSGAALCHAKELALTEYLLSDATIISDVISSGQKLSRQELSLYLQSPNNILAIEYLTALKKLNSSIRPITVKRTDNGYHSLELSENAYGLLASATAVRHMILSSDDSYKNYVPENTHEILSHEIRHSFPIVENDFSSMLGYRLNEYAYCTTDKKPEYFDVPQSIQNRIMKHLDTFMDVTSFINETNSKSITSAYIRRALFQFLLQFTQQDYHTLESLTSYPYVRILGFNKKGADLLKIIKKSQTPIITKLSSNTLQDGFSKYMLNLSMKADAVYRMAVMHKYKCYVPDEHRTGLILNE